MEEKTVKVGDVVKWAKPIDADEAKERYILREHNGDRGYMEYICNMNIKPLTLVRIADIEAVES